MFDDIVLRFQGIVDRVARWARLSLPAATGRRRFLIIQIDGLSREVLDRALATQGLRHLRRLLGTGQMECRPMSVGLPSSTPAFQAAAMYGVRPDIPGFHYYDKRARRELHFPRPGVADFVEQRHAAGRRGILEGGACYGCVFTGGAQDSLLTFARLMKPTRAGLRLVRLPLSAVLLGWVLVKCLALTGVELARFLARVVANPRVARPPWLRWLGLKIVFSIWVRELFTLAVSADLYRGAPAVYVNYLDYDVFAHAFGPAHRSAIRALHHIDSSIGQLARIAARLPELHYDLYVLSDHGQALTRYFPQVSGGESIDEAVQAVLARSADAATASRGAGSGAGRPMGLARQLVGYRRPEARGLLQRFFNHLERQISGNGQEPELLEGVRVIAAGPNAFVYFFQSSEPLMLEEIDARYPGAAACLSEHPGIGLVLARSAGGPVCWWRGRRISLSAGGDGPFAKRADCELVLAGLRDLMAMPSAGDLVLYGIGAPDNDVSFIDERGAHAGPSEPEMQTFILHPAGINLPAPLIHPIQLYPHFAAYQADAATDGGEAHERRW